jgi:hypothetical protein
MTAKRSSQLEALMQKHRRLETSEERNERIARDTLAKRAEAVANEAAIDRMIRRNIEQFGP